MHLMTGADQTECIRPNQLAHGEKAPNRAHVGERMGCYLNLGCYSRGYMKFQ